MLSAEIGPYAAYQEETHSKTNKVEEIEIFTEPMLTGNELWGYFSIKCPI